MGSKLFSEEQLNFFKFASIVLDEFSKALREIFVTMWDTKIAPLPTYQTWDDSAAVRSMLLISEGGKTEIPTNKSLQEWDCTALFKATIYAQTFAITDSKGHKKTLSELYLKKKKLAPGSFHPSVNSPSGDSNETLALAIDQLRLLRNKLCHSKDSGIKKTTFDQYVQLTKDAFIAANVSPASVDAIGSLTESDFPTNKVNELKECIHELQASNRFLQEEIMDKICDVDERTLYLDCQLRKLSHSILEVQEFTKTSPMIHEELRKIRSDLTQMTEPQIEKEDDNDEKCPMSGK